MSTPPTPPPARRDWCPECRAYVEVADETTVDYPTRSAWVEAYVVQFVCGHQDSGPETVIGPAPGAVGSPGTDDPARFTNHLMGHDHHDYDTDPPF